MPLCMCGRLTAVRRYAKLHFQLELIGFSDAPPTDGSAEKTLELPDEPHEVEGTGPAGQCSRQHAPATARRRSLPWCRARPRIASRGGERRASDRG